MANLVNYLEVDDYDWNQWLDNAYDPGCSGIWWM
jgi:hypothetical protein